MRAPRKTTFTVWVGKISPKLPNITVRRIFEQCGAIFKFTRFVNPDTKLPKSFCFVEFAGADGAIRAQRLLAHMKVRGSKWEVRKAV